MSYGCQAKKDALPNCSFLLYIPVSFFFFILYKQPLVENFEIGIYFSTSQWQFNYLFPVD